MSEAPLLLPNFGAEERDAEWNGDAAADPGEAASPVLRGAGDLWAASFPAGARWLGEAGAEPAWPADLGERPAQAALAGLDAPGVHAWLNTPAARRAARDAGAELVGAPPEVVRRVHDKAFAHEVAERQRLLPPDLREVVAVLGPEALEDPEAAVRAIESRVAAWPDWIGPRFVLKPRLGTSGRGRAAGEGGRASALRGALARLARRGGALLEPWLERTADLSAALWIDPAGQLVLLGTTELVVDASGLYRGQQGTIDRRGRITSDLPHDEALREAAAEVGVAAAEAGYRGPCGVDAFAFRGPEGRVLVRAPVEWNARFTMGWVAIGLVRRAHARILRELAVRAGERRSFHFALEAPAGGWPRSDRAAGVTCIALGGAEGPGLLVARDREALDRLLP